MDIESTIVSIADRKLRASNPGATVERDAILKAATDTAEFLGHTRGTYDLERVVTMLEERLPIAVGPATVLAVESDDHIDWYRGDYKRERRFFERYVEQLREMNWAEGAIRGVDDDTDRIMEWMENPGREAPWDTRGLVVGHVQSGKTANYAGLICKAADAGYRLIVVLAGMHNALRQQTQKRIDRDFLGYDTRPEKQRTPIGVGLLPLPRAIADHVTTASANGDFNKDVHNNLGMGVQQRPVLLVVKKNARILENLNTWVTETVAKRGDTQSAPLLVIDDEADQASPDTGKQGHKDDDFDPDYNPKVINGEIRKLLGSFPRSAYVAYTATPFANILIHDEREAKNHGEDLFPRNFIVSLQAPTNYIGPSTLFGLNTEDPASSQPPLPICRDVNQTGEAWLLPDHKKDALPRYEGEEIIPPSLEDAILSFILTCTARRVRGQAAAHNSMLVHVSRFKEVHQRVHAQIEPWLADVKRQLRYRTGSKVLVRRLQDLWDKDFVHCSRIVGATPQGRNTPATTWDDIEPELHEAADRIRVQVVNSDLKEPIDYEGHEQTGLSVIAVGGDKLSRGLTLEGLSVSYFLRATKMYDSLMQMGRWFGYRPGYVDLCRLYLPRMLQHWFRHVATASEELRDRLDRMARLGARPKDYGLRVQSHPVLLVTARNKMQHASDQQISFAGDGRIQTVFFRDEMNNKKNGKAITEFITGLGPLPAEGFKVARPDSKEAGSNGRRWLDVPGGRVADLIDALRFPEETFDASDITEYIREQLKADELTKWTVIMPTGQGSKQPFAGVEIRTVQRKIVSDDTDADTEFSYQTILSPGDESLDLEVEEYQLAFELTRRARTAKGKKPPERPAGPDIRLARGRRPERGLLILYPIEPTNGRTDGLGMPLFGLVVSFPESAKRAGSVTYKLNSVEQRLL